MPARFCAGARDAKMFESCYNTTTLQRASRAATVLFHFCWPEKPELTLPILRVRSRCCMVKLDLITPHDQTSWGAAEREVLAKSCKITKCCKSFSEFC